MNHIAIRTVGAAMFGIAAIQAAHAADATIGYAYVGGSGENESLAYVGPVSQGVPLAPVTVVGSGGNISVVPTPPPPAAPSNYQAVIDGMGESQTVRYVPIAPRG